MTRSPYELSIDEIVFTLSDVSGTEESDSVAILGQSRAITALSLGLGIQSKGYNIFIMGSPGTGRRTALLKSLSDYNPSQTILQDKTIVFDFGKPLEPKVLTFPAGTAAAFKRDIHDFVEDIKRIVAIHGESESFKKKRDTLVSDFEKEENRILSEFEAETAAAGFQIIQISDGEDQSTDLAPTTDGQPTSFEDLQGKLPEGEWAALRERYYTLMDKMKSVFNGLKRSRADIDRKIKELRREMTAPLVTAQTEALKRKYPGGGTPEWLDALGEDIGSHLFFFEKARIDEERGVSRRKRTPPLSRYGVNVLVERTDPSKPPIIFENRPTLANLVGTIDLDPELGDDGRSGYLRIRAGSILKASGGVLVLRAEDILNDEDAWPYLKRILQTGILEIHNPPGLLAQPILLKPQPIEVSLKVVMIGGELSYDLLYQADPDFQKLFKVCAEFDSTMERNPKSEARYGAFLRKVVSENGLRPLTPDGVAAVIERGVRLAENRGRLTARFSMIADLLREADWWASRDGKGELDAAAIRRAVEMRSFLHNLPEDKFESMVLSGEILVELQGREVGKVNGLAVHDRGYYAFGCPVVVSARVAPGDGGVINIEGESGLSGEIFDKAVLILSGYLRSRYARNFPLSVTASLCFEQSYTEIDGDSATAAQLCTILSALSGLPLRQDLAITGSVNQLGSVQPVGGVSEKVEGFFSVCSKLGLTGTQGVVIPRRNVANLILSDEVEDAVRAGTFHIYAVDGIDQALEILTGVPAGAETPEGDFPEGSVNHLVSRELLRMAEVIKRYGA
jgi:predicted ATP-dependent protease